jgi:predicted DNA-binding protein
MTKKPRKDPRNRLGTGKEKSVVIVSVRLSYEEYQTIVSLCKDNEVTMSNYIRNNIIPNGN